MPTITKRLIDSLQPGAANSFIWDNALTGFGVKVTPAGGVGFVFQYRTNIIGKSGTVARRIKIGSYRALTVDQARSEAKRLAAGVALGVDPLAARDDARSALEAQRAAKASEAERLESLAFDRLAKVFLNWYEREPKPGGRFRSDRSLETARGVIMGHLVAAFGNTTVSAITPADAMAAIERIPATQVATRKLIHSYGRVMWNWAIRPPREYVGRNVFAILSQPTAKSRDRVLSNYEIRAVWRASSELAPYRRGYFRLLLLTGARRAEISGLRWEELDRAEAIWTLPAARAKNGEVHLTPLSAAAIAELDTMAGGEQWPDTGRVITGDGRAFTGFSAAKRQLDSIIGDRVTEWRVHDLRRTLATGLQKLGVRFEVCEAVLNHVSGSKSGVAGIYQRHDWADEKRNALDAWAQQLANIVGDGKVGDNVIALRA